MFRKTLSFKKIKSNDPIVWRGHEITRIEALSDAIFGFAITLLIMSLEVPHTFEDLMKALHFIFPFGFCFGITMTVWYNQNIFFRRYGLHDTTTIALNASLMFMVLVYMFPLKFMMGAAFHKGFHIDNQAQSNTIYTLYSGGFACFYALFTSMYLNAYKKRAVLGLSDREAFATLMSAYSNLIVTAVSVLVVILASYGFMYYSYFAFILITPAMIILHNKRNKRYHQHFGDKKDIGPVISDALEAIPDDDVSGVFKNKQS